MRVLVYGDFIVDKYTDVSSNRDCPEQTGAPVYDVQGTDKFLGCAGNVYANMYAMSGLIDDIIFLDVGGAAGPVADSMLGMDTDRSLLRVSSEDIVKERIVLDGKIRCRVDSARTFRWKRVNAPVPVPKYDLVIISDYCFGGVDAAVCKQLIADTPVSVVDTKREDLSIFDGATVFKFNRLEYEHHRNECIPSKWVVISRGEEGCRVIGVDQAVSSVSIDVAPHKMKKIEDVTGCGDTFTAALGLYLASGRSTIMSAFAANYLASRVVSRMGPSVPTGDEIEEGRKAGIL